MKALWRLSGESLELRPEQGQDGVRRSPHGQWVFLRDRNRHISGVTGVVGTIGRGANDEGVISPMIPHVLELLGWAELEASSVLAAITVVVKEGKQGRRQAVYLNHYYFPSSRHSPESE